MTLLVIPLVRAKGIEPIRHSAPDPKSGLSTNFNTPATAFHRFPSGKDCKCTTNYRIYKFKCKSSLAISESIVLSGWNMKTSE